MLLTPSIKKGPESSARAGGASALFSEQHPEEEESDSDFKSMRDVTPVNTRGRDTEHVCGIRASFQQMPQFHMTRWGGERNFQFQ